MKKIDVFENDKMGFQAKKKSFWSTFKNAYLRSKNLKRFWKNLDKKNLSNEIVETFDLYLNSESYKWSAKIWRHASMNHLKLIASDKENYENLISQEYFTWSYYNESLINDAWKKVQNKTINLNIDLFKKQNNFSLMQSIDHNLILLLLYENIKTREIFKHINKLINLDLNNISSKPYLMIDNMKISQDNINSLLEYEQIEKLLNKISTKNGNFLEIGAGSGRTANAVLSIKENVKYVIVDIPPAINICLKNLRNYFPNKKISIAFKLNKTSDLTEALSKNDILFIFPHQISLFQDNTFDTVLAIDCLHEMDKKTIKKYMGVFENISKSLYFKVFEHSGLAYSFYQYHSVHKKEDYSIKDHWIEHFKQKCLYPSNFFELGYEFTKS